MARHHTRFLHITSSYIIEVRSGAIRLCSCVSQDLWSTFDGLRYACFCQRMVQWLSFTKFHMRLCALKSCQTSPQCYIWDYACAYTIFSSICNLTTSVSALETESKQQPKISSRISEYIDIDIKTVPSWPNHHMTWLQTKFSLVWTHLMLVNNDSKLIWVQIEP